MADPSNAICLFMSEAHANARAKGFWDAPRNDGEMIALMHSELSEALEALRKPDKRDEHLPELHPVGLELADLLIRVFDYAEGRRIPLAQCLLAKMEYNKGRPAMHGKAF